MILLRNLTTKYMVVAAIFEDIVSGVIPVPVDKINKMAESGAPRLGANEVGFLLDVFDYCCIIK